MVPLLFIIYGVSASVAPLYLFTQGELKIDLLNLGDLNKLPLWCLVLVNLSPVSYLNAHILIAFQYLQTSLILPKLYTKVRVEWLEDNATKNAEYGGLSINPLVNELGINSIEVKESNLPEIFKKCDELVTTQKQEIVKVKRCFKIAILMFTLFCLSIEPSYLISPHMPYYVFNVA